MGFIDFLAYVKHLGENALVFFPSKTDHISVVDSNGNATDEMLSERLETIQNTMNNTVTCNEMDILINNLIPWDELKAEKSGYLGVTQNKYGIPYNGLETEETYLLLLQNGAMAEFSYHGDHNIPDAVVLYKKIPVGYTLCGCGNNSMPYGTGYIYYAEDNKEKNCPDIKIVNKTDFLHNVRRVELKNAGGLAKAAYNYLGEGTIGNAGPYCYIAITSNVKIGDIFYLSEKGKATYGSDLEIGYYKISEVVYYGGGVSVSDENVGSGFVIVHGDKEKATYLGKNYIVET